MKNYSKEEISKIVSDCSNTILETNVQSFIDEALDIAKKMAKVTMIQSLKCLYLFIRRLNKIVAIQSQKY